MSTSEWPRHTWHIAKPNPALVTSLQQALPSLPQDFHQALVNRGITTADKARHYLNPSFSDLVDPEQIPGISQAATLLRKAIEERAPIVVFGDYDADGICATTILTSALESLGGRVTPFIPSRLTEGYGFTDAAVMRLFREHPETRLVITVDCGISQPTGSDLCHQHGARVIITDHHTLPDPLPTADVIAHAGLPGGPEATRFLCGAGLAFKLAHALSRGPNNTRLFNPAELLPYAAFATVADIVPLTDENRLLVAAGLQLINKGACPGIQALKAASGIKDKVTSSHIGFQLGPRVNAAGRIGDPMRAYTLLRAKSLSEARPIADSLSELNLQRQAMVTEAADEAFSDLAFTFDPASRSIVVANEQWHPGILGLIAGRLAERLCLPAIALHIDREKGTAHGSARCPEHEGLHLMNLFQACEPHILRYGGHAAAGGLTVALDHLDAFREAFQRACAAVLPTPVHEVLPIDGWIDPNLLSLDFHYTFERLQPFGAHNPSIRWAAHDLILSCDPLPLGAEGQYRKFFFLRPNNVPLEAVMFQNATIPMPWHTGDHVDIAFHTDISTFNGISLSLQIDDIRTSLP